MRTHFRAFEDPKSLFSLKCEMVIKKRVFTTLHILWQTLIFSLWYDCCTYHFPGDACTTRCCWIFLYFFIYGRGTHFQVPRYIIIEENYAFCVKWGLIESPFQQFGPHEDQLLNWGPLCFAVRTRCGPFEQFGPHAVLAKTESCVADLRSKAFKFKKETFRVKCGLFPNLF